MLEDLIARLLVVEGEICGFEIGRIIFAFGRRG
jgi:hypothetical protein